MAHLLIVELPGGNDTDILQAALERGDEFSFLSADLDHYRHQAFRVQVMLAFATEQIEVKGFDETEVRERVLELHARRPIDAVLCLVDLRVAQAARLAHALRVHCLNPSSAELLHDKFKVRERLTAHGIEQPPYALACSNAEVRDAVVQLGLPVLIKPCDGHASQNIVLLRYPEDLDPVLSPLDDLLPMGRDYGLGVRANDRLVVERFMEGTVIGCDTWTVNGRHRLLGVHQKLFYDPPSFAIRGSTFVPNQAWFEPIETYLFAALDALGFDCGATHSELVLTADGPRLIEINPRLVGARMARLVGLALGRSICQDLITLHLGEMPALPPARATPTVAAIRWIVADRAGILDHVELPAERDPRICAVEVLKHAGDAVGPPMENADRIGYVMVCASTCGEAEQLAQQFVQAARVRLKPELAWAGTSVPGPDGSRRAGPSKPA